jgi:hypothetical protein
VICVVPEIGEFWRVTCQGQPVEEDHCLCES